MKRFNERIDYFLLSQGKFIVPYGIDAYSSRHAVTRKRRMMQGARCFATVLATSMQDEVAELRARLVHAGENLAEKSQELAVKAQEEASVRGLATALEHRLQEAESDLSVLKDVSRSTAEQLSSALTSASELQCALSKVSELESVVGDLEGEKLRLEEITAAVKGQLEQVTTKLEELQGAIRSFEEEGAKMSRTVQEAQEGRAVLVMEMGRIATLVG